MRNIKYIGLALVLLCAVLAAQARAAAENAEDFYQKARKRYYQLIQAKDKKRVEWLDVINSFQRIIQQYPQSNRAIDAQYTIGLLFKNLSAHSGDTHDLDRAIDSFQKVALKDPQHALADDALYHVAEVYRAWKKDPIAAYLAYKRVYEVHPTGDMAGKAREKAAQLNRETGVSKTSEKSSSLAKLEKITYWSKPNYTRVVVYLDRPAKYKNPQRLHSDRKHKRPARLYFDIEGAKLGAAVKKPVKIEDGLLKRVRSGQYTHNTARVVMDIESIEDYQIVSWNELFRIIIDVHGKNSKHKAQAPDVKQLEQEIDDEVEKIIARQSASVRKIVIDAGHGGSDPGAIGRRGTKEKDITLDISLQLAAKLRKNGFDVHMTRDKDVFLSLEERTAIANEKKADMFISVHANASPKRHATGLSTYVFNNSDDEESMRIAAMENATSYGAEYDSNSYLQLTLASLRKDQQTNVSRDLAMQVQKSMVNTVKPKYGKVRNLGIREAYFYVLLGAQMPCILVETSFISNPTEERRLRSKTYRGHIADGIAEGVKRFVKARKIAVAQLEGGKK